METDDDALSLFPSEDENILTAGQKSQGQDTSPGAETSSGSQELPLVSQQEEVLHRAAAALDIMLPEETTPYLPLQGEGGNAASVGESAPPARF